MKGFSSCAQGQKDPLVEYKNEAYKIFVDLMDTIDNEALGNLFRFTTVSSMDSVLANQPQQTSGGESALTP